MIRTKVHLGKIIKRKCANEAKFHQITAHLTEKKYHQLGGV